MKRKVNGNDVKNLTVRMAVSGRIDLLVHYKALSRSQKRDLWKHFNQRLEGTAPLSFTYTPHHGWTPAR